MIIIYWRVFLAPTAFLVGFFSLLYVGAIFTFISELFTYRIRIQEASDYADPLGSGSETLLKTIFTVALMPMEAFAANHENV